MHQVQNRRQQSTGVTHTDPENEGGNIQAPNLGVIQICHAHPYLILVDLASIGITGIEAQDALQAAGIVANRNTVPFASSDSRLHSTGIRFGTPAVTTRGFGTGEMKRIAALVVKIITNIKDENIRTEVRNEVAGICQRFPVPGIDN